MKAIAALGFLVLLLLAPPAVSQVPDDKLIVPGQRIGKWTLSMTVNDLLKMNGPRRPFPTGGPSSGRLSPFLPDAATDDLWSHVWGHLGFSVVVLGRDSQRILALVVIFSEYKTEKGISVGSTRQAVEATFGRPTAVTHGRAMVYDKIGVMTRLGVAGTVENIVVFRPGDAKTIWKF